MGRFITQNGKIDCLGDGIGFIQYVDHMGDDVNVVNGARASLDKHVDEFVEERDSKLFSTLARAENIHWAPFAHTAVSVRVKAPISMQRQWFKHVVGVVHNSESTRYVNMKQEFYIPSHLRQQSQSRKQGSEGFLDFDSSNHWGARIEQHYSTASTLYEFLLKAGVAREQARDVLPMATYTTWISTMSLYAAWRIYKQRTKDGAQAEIAEYAQGLGVICKNLYPNSWAALLEHNYA